MFDIFYQIPLRFIPNQLVTYSLISIDIYSEMYLISITNIIAISISKSIIYVQYIGSKCAKL